MHGPPKDEFASPFVRFCTRVPRIEHDGFLGICFPVEPLFALRSCAFSCFKLQTVLRLQVSVTSNGLMVCWKMNLAARGSVRQWDACLFMWRSEAVGNFHPWERVSLVWVCHGVFGKAGSAILVEYCWVNHLSFVQPHQAVGVHVSQHRNIGFDFKTSNGSDLKKFHFENTVFWRVLSPPLFRAVLSPLSNWSKNRWNAIWLYTWNGNFTKS